MAEEVIEIDENKQEWVPSKNPWLLCIPTIFAAFMFVLDATVANVALPHMSGTFSSSREESMWILTSYLVASGIMIPAVDWFCKLLGRKTFFTLSIMLFTAASVFCGLAESLSIMIFARILQGFGGGGILPIAQAVMLEAFPVKMRGKAMALFGMVVIVAPIIGPVLGGWITDNLSWPWIFFINLPVGILTVFLTRWLLEDPPYAEKQKNLKIDAKGFFFLTSWLVSLQVVLDKGNNSDWFNAPWICWLSAFSAASFLLFLWSQLTNKESLLDLRVFKDKNFAIGTFIQVIIQAILLASVAILPQFLQTLLGYSAYLSGLSMMPRGVGALSSILLCGYLSTKVDNRILAMFGLSLIGTAGFILGNLNMQIAPMNIVIPNFIFGFGMGFAGIPLISLSVITLKNNQMTNASGLQNLLKNIGGAVGTSVIGTLITRYSQIHQHTLVGNLNPLNPIFQAKVNAVQGAIAKYTHPVIANQMAQYSVYGELVKQSTLWGFMEAFRWCCIAAFFVIPLILLMKKINFSKHK